MIWSMLWDILMKVWIWMKIREIIEITNTKLWAVEQEDILQESPILKDLYKIKGSKYESDF